MAAGTTSTVVELPIHNLEGIPGVESIISYQCRHPSINSTQSSTYRSSTTSRKIMESISVGSKWTGERHMRTTFWEGGGIGSLSERALETFRDLTGLV